ncbi:hypothetical protein VNO77_41716 [Canavalia gladiata]|uniref:Uncharacterized protein n=1 Tax=Canavalia gladiata TaxID=3824 RepID=A0AAN9PS20_CANGL
MSKVNGATQAGVLKVVLHHVNGCLREKISSPENRGWNEISEPSSTSDIDMELCEPLMLVFRGGSSNSS